jgi:transcriptional regulator GlxA family with amidase domain
MAQRKLASNARRVAVIALPGAFSLDVLGTYEVFNAATHLLALRALGHPQIDGGIAAQLVAAPLAYEVELVGAESGKVDSLSGVGLFATRAIADLRGPIDTLVVAGGDIARMLTALRANADLSRALRRVAKRARRVVSVCTGSFVLASLGLLDGKRATTHWAACDLLQKQYPNVRVEREPIYTQDGSVYTSAGATTGMDLSLALVREDHGSELAREIARWLVLYVERSADQPQWSASLRAQASDREPIRDLVAWIEEHITDDLSVTRLAAQVGMSVRNFARAFKRELDVTPATYVEAVRVEAVRRKLEMGTASVAEIASEVGFGSVDTLRRALVRHTGRAPSASRKVRAAASRHSIALVHARELERAVARAKLAR